MLSIPPFLTHKYSCALSHGSQLDEICAVDLKRIYHSMTEDEALLALEQFAERWDEKYPQISKSWRSHWNNPNTRFNYPEDIRKAIYTANTIKSLKFCDNFRCFMIR